MNQANRFFLLGAGVSAVLIATIVLAIIPTNRRRDALHADTEQKLAAMSALNESIAASAGVNARVVELRHAIASVDSRFPPATQMNQIAEEIWRLAQANSLQTRTLKTSVGKRTGSYFAHDMDFALEGPLAALQKFTRQLERMPYAVRVEKMAVNRVGGREGVMQIDLTLSVYLQSDSLAAPASMANIPIEQR